MPKIGVDCRALAPPMTGIGNLLVHLLSHLGELCDLHLYTPRPLAPSAPSIRGTWHVGPGVKGNIFYHGFLPNQLLSDRIDLFLAPLNILPVRCPVPSLLIVHDVTPLEHPGWHRFKNRITTVPFYDSSFFRADSIATVSRSTKEILERLFPQCRGKCIVIPPGRPVPLKGETTSLNQLPETFLFTLSTIEPRKNLQALLEAHKMDRSLPPLVVAGARGWKVKVKNRERVIWLGYVDEKMKWDLYRKAALFIFPSLKEGFGLPVWESLSAGTAVVTTAIPSAVEYSHPYCHVVEPSPGAILGGIHQMLSKKSTIIPRLPDPSWSEIARIYYEEMIRILKKPA